MKSCGSHSVVIQMEWPGLYRGYTTTPLPDYAKYQAKSNPLNILWSYELNGFIENKCNSIFSSLFAEGIEIEIETLYVNFLLRTKLAWMLCLVFIETQTNI